MEEVLEKIHSLIWGVPMLVLILAVGTYLTLACRFVQLRFFPEALRRFWGQLVFRDRDQGQTPFRCLCTALGATVGTGNLVGVAGAICLGGPGSIFWMWVCGFLAMATKYAEAVLAVRYRQRRRHGWIGGPMYSISRGMGPGWNWLACCYCIFGLVAALGVGNATQINALTGAVNAVTGHSSRLGNLIMGLGISLLVGVMLAGGAGRIGATAERLVPLAAGGYILAALVVLFLRRELLPEAFRQIFVSAVSPKAVTGGIVGSWLRVLRVGCTRGVFTNEAGMGTASIAHAGAQVDHPAQQGMMGILEVFLDTLVICTLTALVILVSGVPIGYGEDLGAALTSDAFSAVCGGWIRIPLALALGCFALATILGWGLYAISCAEFLFGEGAGAWLVPVQMGASLLGAVLQTGVIWTLAEIVNGLMALPNLICLWILSDEVLRITGEYRKPAKNLINPDKNKRMEDYGCISGPIAL